MESGTAYFFRPALNKLLLLLVIFMMPVISHAKELPREFTANYALEMHGAVLARATYTLEHTDNGVSMTQSTRPVGLAALLRDDKIDVRSDMVVSNGRLLLINYDYTHTGDDKDRDIRFTINWKANHRQELIGKATGVYEGRHVELVIDDPVWDPLSIQVPIMLEANKDMPPHEHRMFMSGEFKHYLFENHGPDKVSFKGTEFNAVKIAGRETQRDRAMYVWMIPELGNIPVKIEQWKNGEIKSTVLLENVTFKEGVQVRAHAQIDSPSSIIN